MDERVSYEEADGIATIVMDDGKANALSPAMQGEIHAALDRAEAAGAFVVLATARRHGYFATYLVARLHLRAKRKPTSEDCAGSVISAFHMGLPYVPRDPMVKVTSTTAAETRKLRLEKIGRFELDEAELREAFPERYETLDSPSWSLPGLLRPYGEGIAVVLEHPVPMKTLSLRRFLR